MNSEELIIDKIPAPNQTELDILISKLRDRTFTLSYSKLKHLTSPVNFMNNLLAPKRANAGMNFGSIVDVLITEEENFYKKYLVSDISISAGNQENMVEMMMLNKDRITDDESLQEVFEEAFKACYKSGKIESVEKVKVYVKNLLSGITVISESDYNDAVRCANKLRQVPEIEDILSQSEGMQQYFEFEYRGWKFRCYLDILSLQTVFDLKFVSQLNPDLFQRDIEKYGYDIQMAIYKKAVQQSGVKDNLHVGCSFITYDKVGNYSVISMADDYIAYAEKKLDVYINRLERMIKDNAYFQSYDYFTPNRKIHKPKYIAGFSELDLMNV